MTSFILQAAGTLSVVGVAFGLLSSVFVALNGIFTKKAMNELEGIDSVKMTLHVNINASVLLVFPALLTGQVRVIFSMRSFPNRPYHVPQDTKFINLV